MKNKVELNYIYNNTKRFLPAIIFRSLLSCVSALLLFSFSIISGRVIDIATGAKTGSIAAFTVLLFSSILLYILCYAGGVHLSARIDARIKNCFQKNLFRSYCNKKSEPSAELHTGDVLNRFTEDINTVSHGVTTIIPSIVSFISRIVVGFASLIVMSPLLGIVFIIGGILFPTVGRIVSQKYKSIHKQALHTGGIVRSFLQECFANMTVVKSFSAAGVMEHKLEAEQEEHFGYVVKRSRISVFTHIGIYAIFTLGYYLALVWGAGQLAGGVMTYGTLMASLQIMNQLRQPLQGITGIIPSYLSMVASAERLCELDKREDEPQALDGKALDELKREFRTIDAEGLCFAYDDQKIFENASFSINRGDIVAVTGRSGIGKTTLFRLLLGLLEPTGGSLTFNGAARITAAHRSMFAFVPQGNMILSGTIRENIAFACTGADDERIKKAATAAGIYDFIEGLPKGFDTLLSERGAGLSEGQIQRIAIARALLTDAPILLLDECSSALDEETERELLESLAKLSDKTILFITHREKVLSICNKQLNLG